jgi:hypothetical protein
MRAVITINMDGAAFEGDEGEDCGGLELARIFRRLAWVVERDCAPGYVSILRDINGNRVGEMRIEEGGSSYAPCERSLVGCPSCSCRVPDVPRQ